MCWMLADGTYAESSSAAQGTSMATGGAFVSYCLWSSVFSSRCHTTSGANGNERVRQVRAFTNLGVQQIHRLHLPIAYDLSRLMWWYKCCCVTALIPCKVQYCPQGGKHFDAEPVIPMWEVP